MKRSPFYITVFFLASVFACTSCTKKEQQPTGNATYNAMAAQLEPGHEFFMVTGFEGEIEKGVELVTPLLRTAIKAYVVESAAPVPINAFPLKIKEAVQATGISSVAGIGYSSRKEQNGMFHNRTFVYMPQGRRGVFLVNGENRELTLSQRAPANTWLMAEADYDLTHLLPIVENIMVYLVGEEMAQPVKQSVINIPIGNDPAMPTWGALLDEAKFSIELVVAADKDLVMAEYRGVSIPAVDAYLLIRGPISLFKNQIEEFAEGAETAGQIVKRSQDHIRVEIQEAIPWGEGEWDVRPVMDMDFAQESIRVYSNLAFEETMKSSSNRLRSQIDFQQVTRNLPTEGTSRFYISKNLVALGKNLLDSVLQTAIEEERDETAVSILEELRKLGDLFLDWNTGVAGVTRNTKDGLLYQENHYFSHRTKLFGALLIDGLSGSAPSLLMQMAPAVPGARSKAVDVAIINNLRGLGVMVRMHQAAHNQPVRLKELKQEYDYEINPVAGEIYPDFLFPVDESWEYVVVYNGTYYVLDDTGKVTQRKEVEQ